MTAYTQKTFTVPVGQRAPAGCEHGWEDRRGLCVFCGVTLRVTFRDFVDTDPTPPAFTATMRFDFKAHDAP